MKESILHYVWQHRLYSSGSLSTVTGERVEVIDPGKYNTDAGPDFFNAKVKIGDTLWAGNVEIHLQASDWKKHNHHLDKAYDNVILHVVSLTDELVYRTNGEEIPQLLMNCPPTVAQEYEQLMAAVRWIACADKVHTVPPVFIRSWKTALLTERLQQKMQSVEQLLAASQMHWEEAFYVTLARSFGFGTNSQAFELLAQSIPLHCLAKHKDNLFQIEALLLGQSGLLQRVQDDYAQKLRKEYEFLSLKYQLTPLEATQWKLLRLRPENFPQIRIAQFAALIHSSVKLFSRILDCPQIDAVRKLFACQPSDYWSTHYVFGEAGPVRSHQLGRNSVDSILINTVVPFLFCYASHKGNDDLKEAALLLLEQLPVENNAIVRGWQALGISADSAYDSQALLQLKKYYCDEKKCLRCRIGHKVLTRPSQGAAPESKSE